MKMEESDATASKQWFAHKSVNFKTKGSQFLLYQDENVVIAL